METRFTLFLKGISRGCLYIIVFLTPLIWLPFTAEQYQLTKYFLIYALTLLSLLCFVWRVIKMREVVIQRTPLDWPLILLWLGILVVSLTSEQRYISLVGDFSSPGLSFLSFSVLAIFYWLVVQQFNAKEQIMKMVYVLLVSGALTAVYFILRTFKLLTLPWALPLFSPVHSSNSIFGLFILTIFIISLGLLAIRTRSIILDIFAFIVMALCAVTAVLIGFKLLWILLAITLALLLIFFLTYLDELRSWWSSATFALLVGVLLLVFLGAPQWLSVGIPAEISLGSNLSWNIATTSLLDNLKQFFLGSGPGTFGYRFSQFRPAVMNSNFAWNLRFNQSYSTALDWLPTMGVPVSLLFVIVVLILVGLIVAAWVRQLSDHRKRKRLGDIEDVGNFYDSPLLFWSLVGGWFMITISFCVANWGAVQWMMWWLLTGFLVTMSSQIADASLPTTTLSLKTTPQYALVTSFTCITAVSIIVVLGVYLARWYSAEVVYAKSFGQAPNVKIANIQKALDWNSHRTLFHLALADSFLARAVEIVNKKGDVSQVYQSVALAVESAKRATDNEPKNVAAWEFLSTMYANARAVAPEANDWLIRSLDQAIKLEPTNPVFFLGRGNALLLVRRYADAAKDFEQAALLKPDWSVPVVRLALTKELQGNLDGAIEALEAKILVGQNDPEYVFQLGRYHFNRRKNNDNALAEILFKRAIILNPNYADALYGLASLYQATGNKDLAIPLLKRVAELNPNNKEIRNKLELLTEPPPPPPPAPEPANDQKKK